MSKQMLRRCTIVVIFLVVISIAIPANFFISQSYLWVVRVDVQFTTVLRRQPWGENQVAVNPNKTIFIDEPLGHVQVKSKETTVDAPLRHVQVKSKATSTRSSSCFISSHGKDGIGHQMEAKVSCLATAVVLNLTYVHQPVQQLEHGVNPEHMEDLFGFSLAVPHLSEFAVLYNSSTMQLRRRKPLPFIGRCHESSWFDSYNETCAADAEKNKKIRPVYTHDNCWDFFWCQESELPVIWWQTVVPVLRDTFLRGLLLQHSMPLTKRNPGKILVVMHLRMGDAGKRKSDEAWSRLVLQNLWEAACSNVDGLQIIIHSDGVRDTLLDMLGMNDDSSEMSDSVTIYGRGDENATLESALYDMVTADILVSADSSLSHIAGMLRTREHGPVTHPETRERARMGALLGWNMIRTSHDGHLEVCTAVPQEGASVCGKWEPTEKDFWSNLVRRERETHLRSTPTE
jgi:hypothetical protein